MIIHSAVPRTESQQNDLFPGEDVEVVFLRSGLIVVFL